MLHVSLQSVKYLTSFLFLLEKNEKKNAWQKKKKGPDPKVLRGRQCRCIPFIVLIYHFNMEG